MILSCSLVTRHELILSFVSNEMTIKFVKYPENLIRKLLCQYKPKARRRYGRPIHNGKKCFNLGRRGSSVSIVSDYGPDDRGSIPDRGGVFF
jgi:hypothetical protein